MVDPESVKQRIKTKMIEQAATKGDTKRLESIGFTKEGAKDVVRAHELIRKERGGKARIILAKKGFHGNVKQPTIIIAGEAGSEHVRILPIKHRKDKNLLDNLNDALYG